jgi:endonuclease YncB( thermonuclease family)
MRRLRPALIATLPAIALVIALPARAEWLGPCRSDVPPGVPPGPTTPICHFWRGKLKWVDDGDTIDVRMPTSTGKVKTVRVRIIGVQAMEQSVYTSNPRKRRGECHALPATARLERLIRKGRGVVRLGSQDPSSESGRRLRRSVAVKIRGVWKDVGRTLVAEGHALWLPYTVEYAWNADYSTLAQQAAARGLNLWDTNACGVGPSEGVPLRLTVSPDPRGNDQQNLNGEQVTIQNLSLTAAVPLDGWWLRDSSLARFEFPAWAVIPPGGSVTVSVGRGVDTGSAFYWGLGHPIFENATQDGRGLGDGAYLFDPQGDVRAWMTYPCYVNCAPT